MVNESWTSVRVFSLDIPEIQRALEKFVAELARRPEVLKIILFGSMVNDRYAPGSDVDILVVISESDKPFRNRVPEYLPRRFPVGLDVFPYTQDEANRLAVPREALAEGKILWQRKHKSTSHNRASQ